jgi:RNA polymerase sigma factor (sigma-70 family)
LFYGERVTIGRRSSNALVLDSPEVSQHHAVLERRDGTWVVLDCGSTNGTTVAGERVPPGKAWSLGPGASLTVGPCRMQLGGDVAAPALLAADTRADVSAARDNAGASSWQRLSERIVELLRARFPRGTLPPALEFDDFASEVMLLVVRDLARFEPRGPGSFLAWVHTLAQNRLVDLWRHYNARRRREPGPRQVADFDALPDAAAGSGSQMLRLRELEAIEMECVAGLASDARTVYLMRRRDEADFDAICAQVGRVSAVAARSLFKRAREQVRECIARKADALGPGLRE